MKSAEQWAKRVQNSKEPWAKLVAEIQSDAYQQALADAEDACVKNAATGNVGGWTNGVSMDCANLIRSIAVDAMPNSYSPPSKDV
jgi:hypothetical protein